MAKRQLFIPRTALFEQWEKDFKKYKIIYLGAHTGWGKTVALKSWAAHTALTCQYTTADALQKETITIKGTRAVLIIDDLHKLPTAQQDAAGRQRPGTQMAEVVYHYAFNDSVSVSGAGV